MLFEVYNIFYTYINGGYQKMSRVYNFSAGPSMLPEEVLKKAQAEMLECGDSGMSVMEMSHRSKDYDKIIKGAEALVRELMNVLTTTRLCLYRVAVQRSSLWYR